MAGRRPSRTLALLLPLLALAGAGYLWQAPSGDSDAQHYKTQTADRGDIVKNVSANGTLNPVVQVNVGTQVSGTVQRLHVDFNQRVQPGQVLAELDPALFTAQLRQSEASVQNAEASLKLARAKEERTRTLVARNFITRSELELAEQASEAAAAQLSQARAQLERDHTNLRYSVIRSPIAGVVVARNVDVGQTVAASFQTPTLFQIAKDLRQMQIDTSVAEADVGVMRVGQPVRFTVDAYPDTEFAGEVKQVRLNPTIQQNVVTYNVVVAVDNAEGRLIPGMTAHVRVIVERRSGVLRVPNAALRYRPGGEPARPSGVTVYRLAKGKPQPVSLRPGAADSTCTEVLGGDIKEGDALVVREVAPAKEARGNFRLRLF